MRRRGTLRSVLAITPDEQKRPATIAGRFHLIDKSMAIEDRTQEDDCM
jgi:hypothetical protein